MAKHQLRTSKKKQKGNPLEFLNIYPDFGLDAEGYDASVIKCVIVTLGIMIMLACAIFADRLNRYVLIGMYAVSLLLGGFLCISNLAMNISSGRVFSESLPVFLAVVSAFAAGYRRTAVISVAIYEIAKIFENYCYKKEHLKANAVLSVLPRYANIVLPMNKTVRRKPSHLKEGDVVVVREDEVIPIDGYVIDGMSTVDCTPLTADIQTMAVNKGSFVFSGAKNMSAPILVRATCDYRDSTAGRIFSAFSAAIKHQSETALLAQKIYNILFPAAIALALIFGVITPILSKEWVSAVSKAAVICFCACPVGLLEILDLSNFSGIRRIFAAGAVVKDGRIIEELAKTETFVCNKTGTVTENEYNVIEVMPAGFDDENPPDREGAEVTELLDCALLAESASNHPVANAIRAYTGVSEKEAEGVKFTEIPGQGMLASYEGGFILCGNATLLYDYGINCIVPATPGCAIHIAKDNEYLGYIVLTNEVRHGNYDALEKMRAAGVKSFSLISSDLRSVVRGIASALNFSNVKAELSPEKKAKAVAYLAGTKPQGRMLIFCGNGTDESESGKAADIYAATGCLFNKEAFDEADVAILSEGLPKLADSIAAAANSYQISMAFLIANLSARLVVLILGMLGVMSLTVCAGMFAVISIVSNFFINKI